MSFHFDGERWQPGAGVVSLDDRLWRFGDGCFETLLVQRGRAVFASAHLQRLRAAGKRLGFAVPRAASGCLHGLPMDAGALRLWLSAGLGGGLGRRLGKARVLAQLSALRISTAPLVVHSFVRQQHGDLKLPHYPEAIAALRRGGDDALGCDGAGKVLESSSGNVFAWIGGKLLTPPLDGRILPGVSRAVVLQCAKTLALPVAEQALTLSRVRRAQAVFFSSSLRGLAPVVRLDGAPIGDARQVLPALFAAYAAAVARG